MLAKVVEREGTKEVPPGTEGELCIHGPAVMLGYLDQPEETAKVLKKHDDGLVWLHTGDIATMDEDGFLYFKLREKRMIKSSGMNVYPVQVEHQLYRHDAVAEACVIGVPDVEQVERVKAFVVLKDRAVPVPAWSASLSTTAGRTSSSGAVPGRSSLSTSFPRHWWERSPTRTWRPGKSSAFVPRGNIPEIDERPLVLCLLFIADPKDCNTIVFIKGDREI